mmetsp:Transcript_11793/g.30278  ORF Transcript_11793/g.30278 Transcript_11793/m.30278 type:complete len:699 (+) Transcript_11793:122-2218(+)
MPSCGERLSAAWAAFNGADPEELKKAKQKKKRKDDDDAPVDKETGGKLTVSPNIMKLITLITLLVSDFDMLFTITSLVSYYTAGGIFLLFVAIIGVFFLVYIGGCCFAARESTKFIERFTEKVKLNEINGISLEDLSEALDGKRIFWTGPNFDATKKRRAVAQELKLLTADTLGAHELKIPDIEQALKEAEMNGLSELMQAGDPKMGSKLIAAVQKRLKEAKGVQTKREFKRVKTNRSCRSLVGAAAASVGVEDEVPEGVAEPHYTSNVTKAKSRDAQSGLGGNVNHADDEVGAEDDEGNPDDDMQKKVFEDELAAATAANDPLLARKIQMASLKHIDSYKVPAKLLDEKGKVADPIRALFMICEAKGILHSYHQASRTFARRIVKPSHSTPFYRLMEFGWQPSVSHTDFAGILNANALYSFTVGFPQLIFTLAFLVYAAGAENNQVACKSDPCTIEEDFNKPNVQAVLVAGSLAVGIASLIISVVNIVVDFPAQLFDIAEKEDEALYFTLQAEEATRTWEDKLQLEVQENVKTLLKQSTQYEDNINQGREAPSLVIEKVMIIERAAMEQKVGYIEHCLGMQEEEKERRDALRQGKRKKKEEPKPPPPPESDSDDDDPSINPDVHPPADIEQGGRGATSAAGARAGALGYDANYEEVAEGTQAAEVQLEIDTLRTQREAAAAPAVTPAPHVSFAPASE